MIGSPGEGCDECEIVVTSEAHRFLVAEQLRQAGIKSATLLLEPAARNTAAALTLAALCAQERVVENVSSMPILVVMPADQIVHDSEAFTRAIKNCIDEIDRDKDAKTIALLGVPPASPETGYGYICRSVDGMVDGLSLIKQFCEKPNLMLAKKYCEDGNYFWNAGIFVLRADTWLAAISQFRPDILEATLKSWHVKQSDIIRDGSESLHFVRPGLEQFNAIPAESIDYAVIEKCPGSSFSLKMSELNAGWSDLGSWDAVWKTADKDTNGNVGDGDALFLNTTNTLVHAQDRLVVATGVNNLVIIDTADALLVMDQSCSQDVKRVVANLANNSRSEIDLHRKVYRPWGWYDSIEEGPGFKVKRILVNPGASLSLQKHHHRAEHWVVVRGRAEVMNGDQRLMLSENQSTYIAKGQTHRLSNLDTEPLEIIEIQSGQYLGEDDIVRLDDIYGRQ